MAVGTPTTATGNSITPAVAVPSGVASGDIVILLLNVDNSGSAFNTKWPSGFTNLDDRTLTLDGQRVGSAWKRLTGADSGSYTMASIGGTGNWNYGMVAIPLTGRHATNPPVLGTVTADNNANAGTSLTITATGVTAVAGDDILHVAMEDVATNAIGNGHSSWLLGTEIVDQIDAGSGWVNIGTAKAENVSAGATGNETVSFSKSPSGNNGFVTYLIRVPSGASTTQVSATRRVTYNVLANVAATRRVNYAVAAQVVATRRVVYNVLANVAATRRLVYAVLAAVVATRRVTYNVQAQVAATRRINYSVLANVVSARRLRYNVLAQVAGTRRVTYNVVAPVVATRRVTYAVTANVVASRRVSYVVGDPVGGTGLFLPLVGVGR